MQWSEIDAYNSVLAGKMSELAVTGYLVEILSSEYPFIVFISRGPKIKILTFIRGGERVWVGKLVTDA